MSKFVFVFGSNLAGRHGKGAALYARQHYGAEYGVGIGRTGQAYALPTKTSELRTLPIAAVQMAVLHFMDYARRNPDEQFEVTPVGTGLACYSEDVIRPFFNDAPANCRFASTWRVAPTPTNGQKDDGE